MKLLLRTPVGLRPLYVLNKNLKENVNRKKLMNFFEIEIMVIRGCPLSRNTLYTFPGIRIHGDGSEAEHCRSKEGEFFYKMMKGI